MRTKLLAAAAAIASVLVVAPMPASADYVPAGFAAFTQDLEEGGYVNGMMDSDRLMSSHGCLLERDAAYTFALMMEAADKAGVRLEGDDCYRSYYRQKAAWEYRCPYTDVQVTVTDPDTGEGGVGVRRFRVCSGPPTARAGESNHGWGRAIDFSDGSGSLTCRDSEFLWLQANAYKFGWVHPPWAQCGSRTEEAWHWEWAGVVDENLVPDYSSIWIFDDITLARVGSNLEYSPPFPPPGLGEDDDFFERWNGLGHGAFSAFPDE